MADEAVSADEIQHALKDEEIHLALVAYANRGAEYWKEIALEHKDSGEYIESIIVVDNGVDDVAVVATSDIAHILEFGSVDTPEFAFRARTEAYFNNGGE